ncbi:GntR family transcriptional regulator [Nocardia cyriacigeorgica]|uniref:GntR family transcriptional regulator n=1 Tax=Nocardia cyriacigeorgica TaxID=135487 RepID=UPI0024568E24|nr:GntR family transcriptional regulator [Nocardia cyriacigeorgica]
MAEQLIDPDDPRPTYVRIAEKLRDDFEPGGRLPSAPKLAEEWGVAKETVRAAIDVLRREGLIVSWQGRGTFYRAPDESAGTSEDDAAILRHIETIMTRLDDFEARLSSLEQTQRPEASQ